MRRLGRELGWRNLTQMRAFFLAWPVQKILQTLSAKSVPLEELAKRFPLPWSAHGRLLSVKIEDARTFYEAETLRSAWSVRQLGRQIACQFHERLALSRNKTAVLTAESALVSTAMLLIGAIALGVAISLSIPLNDGWSKMSKSSH